MSMIILDKDEWDSLLQRVEDLENAIYEKENDELEDDEESEDESESKKSVF